MAEKQRLKPGSPDEVIEYYIASIKVETILSKAYCVILAKQGITIRMELDTGSAVSIILERILIKHLRHLKLQLVTTCFRTYSGEKLMPLGNITVDVQYVLEQRQDVKLYVLHEGKPILGRDWLQFFQINWPKLQLHYNMPEVKQIENSTYRC